MKSYAVDLSCPRCGGEVVHVAGGRPSLFETRAVARCVACRSELVVVVQVCSRGSTVGAA